MSWRTRLAGVAGVAGIQIPKDCETCKVLRDEIVHLRSENVRLQVESRDGYRSEREFVARIFNIPGGPPTQTNVSRPEPIASRQTTRDRQSIMRARERKPSVITQREVTAASKKLDATVKDAGLETSAAVSSAATR